MSISDLSLLAPSPFVQLRDLLAGAEPGQNPIDMSIGEPKHGFPEFIRDVIAREGEDFGRYPPIAGSEELRGTIAGWLERRYGLAGVISPQKHITALNGTREGLFLASVFLTPSYSAKKTNPAVLIPNPFYPVYAAGALAGGAEIAYLPAMRQNNFLPDLEALGAGILQRAAALFLCSPSNPQGAVASAEYLEKAIMLARKHDFVIFSDECYSEIYAATPPPGILQVAKSTRSLTNVIAFHSLSKRSNLPGLRSGFCAGDERLIAKFTRLRNIAGPQTPLPLQAAAAAAWRDEAHVIKNRELYRAKFDAADEIIGERFGYKRPDGGFFLWLDTASHGGGEAAALKLWREAGLKVLPGSYLAAAADGENPGDKYIRMALVGDEPTTRNALKRLVKVLGE